MKARSYYVWGAALALIVLVFLRWWPNHRDQIDKQPPPSRLGVNDTKDQQSTLREELIAEGLRHEVEFSGRVEDLTGVPVQGAEVMVTKSLAGGGEGPLWLRTDPQGRFFVKDLRAPSLYLKVTPPSGYTETPDSNRSINFFIPTGGDPQSPHGEFRNPKQPIVLFVKKLDPADPVYLKKVTVRMPADGSARYIRLDAPSDEPSSEELGKEGHWLKLECWSSRENRVANPPGGNHPYRYNWRFRISVPGGGVLAAEDQTDEGLLAPASGYRESLDFSFPDNMEEAAWKPSSKWRVFFKLSDSTFGRAEILMETWGGHFSKVETIYNPSGRASTLVDPSKLISR